MAANVPVPAKEYAVASSAAGVPLTDLESVVGTTVERFRHTETITDVSSGSTASRINYKPLQFAAEYRVVLTDSGGTEQLNGTINALTWQGLQFAEVGDTLVHDGQPTQTGHSLAPPDGDPDIPTTIVVGRTEDNFMLLQGIALPDQAVLEVFSTEFTGGEISERLWRQTAAAPHVVRLKGYFLDDTAADAAAINVGYDGSFATGIDGTNWQEQNEPYGAIPDGTTEHWYRADAVYNPLAGRWLISNPDIFAPEGGVTVGYSVSDEGPWHDNQASTDRWRRWRDTSSFWHMEPLNELDDGWRFLTSFVWDGTATPDPGVYTEWAKALAFAIDFNEWKLIQFSLQWSGNGGRTPLTVCSEVLSSGPTTTPGFSEGIARVMHFRRNNTGASYDDTKYDAARRSTTDILGFRYQFLRVAGEESHEASQIRVLIQGSGVVATLRVYVGR